jgi:hypothetical protein
MVKVIGGIDSFENEAMARYSKNIQVEMDKLILESINQLVEMFFEVKPRLSEVRKRVIVGFGPGRSKGVMFKNIIFLDRVPMIEVVLMKDGEKMFLKKRLVGVSV